MLTKTFINTKIFQTSTFRLAAIYLLVFAVSAGSLLGYVYYTTVGLLERQTEDTIHAEIMGLADQYKLLGLAGLLDSINRRSSESNGEIYLLVGPDGKRVVGNLATMPPEITEDQIWSDFQISVGKEPNVVQHTARGFQVQLANEYELLVGRDVQELRQFRDLIREALAWAVGMSLVLGLGGGYMMSRNFLRRVDGISDATQTIMEGNLSGRMPVTGANDELDRLARSLNTMLSQIERLMTGMKEVTSNVAHDLRTPLTRMRARVEAALRQENKAEYKQALDQTIEECDQLLRTFNALLSIAQAEAGQMRQGLQALDLHEILIDVVELYQPLVEEAGGTLTLGESPPMRIRGDRQLIAQVLNNLIDNAMKYGETTEGQGAIIDVRGSTSDNMAVIEVADHGRGIASDDRERVLGRFVRLDQSRTKPGNGLGLSLVASVMTLHSGSLQLEDNNPGLRAVLRLPLLD
ncbi:MAG: HAMP domain-containing histidine kinase [Alphaproteobacteria bacterium]|nr:HAMP domain-containing histidine kinase [Alphaproteobacteria bacterium]